MCIRDRGKSDAYLDLDVSVLHTLILNDIFGIDMENMANQKNLVYTKQAEEAVSGVQNGEFQCSFLLNPTKIHQIKDVSLANEKMPQKSTYFYPKILTGLVMNKLDVYKRQECGQHVAVPDQNPFQASVF